METTQTPQAGSAPFAWQVHEAALETIRSATQADLDVIVGYFSAAELPSMIGHARRLLVAAVNETVDAAAERAGVRRLQLVRHHT